MEVILIIVSIRINIVCYHSPFFRETLLQAVGWIFLFQRHIIFGFAIIPIPTLLICSSNSLIMYLQALQHLIFKKRDIVCLNLKLNISLISILVTILRMIRFQSQN
nr:MAG TPA: hypothetical protein [Caudoviricetes sp.]